MIDPLATSPDYDTGDCKYQSTLQRLCTMTIWRRGMTVSEGATVLDALRNIQVLLSEMETLAQALEDTDHEPPQSFYDAILKARV